jgi:hypothetical protein
MTKATQVTVERMRQFLMGIADLLELLVLKLREFAQELGNMNAFQ